MQDEFYPAEGALTAVCKGESHFRIKDDDLPEGHECPSEQCTCGIYAFHEAEDAIEKYSAGSWTVVGAGIFWGKIVVHTAGFRAQHCRIVALANHRKRNKPDDVGWPALLEGVVEKYNVPVVPLDLRRGQPLPD